MFWNTVYMDKAASHLAKTSPLYDAALLTHTSPLGWEHIILSGDFRRQHLFICNRERSVKQSNHVGLFAKCRHC